MHIIQTNSHPRGHGIEDNFYWPQLAIKNTGLLHQVIEGIQVKIPNDFYKGEIVLACLTKESENEAKEYLKNKRMDAMINLKIIDIVLSTKLHKKGE